MSRIFLLFILLGFTFTAQAVNCPCSGGSRMGSADINDAFGGNTVCAFILKERWQEFHTAVPNIGTAGDLLELGDNAAGDRVGTWTINGTDASDTTVTYDYGTGGSYIYSVCKQGSSYHFCGARNITNAKVNSGKVGCVP